ncbi:hypothetical protein OG535_35260 [Kitasatospora sp. NBC_00085]|uniref:hypothetical protein n=1 Tax=unclassified Kitasatospora TaxID=2633591 RepID=UPI00324A7FB0
MTTAFPARRRAGVPALAGAALAVVLAGCATPGELRDNGATARVTPPPVAQPLWAGLATAPPPAPPTAATDPPPQPVPDVTVPGQDITALDTRTVLAKDPQVTADERRTLDGCPGCELRSPEYRDLTGDGRPELVAAVGTVGPVVLHVYTLAGDRVVPVLRVQVLKGFSAETVGADLWLHEPTTVSVRTSSRYHWDGVRLGLVERKDEGIGPVPAPGQGGAAETGAPPTATPTAVPSAARPSRAPAQPGAPTVGNGTGGAVPAPARPTPAPPEAKP